MHRQPEPQQSLSISVIIPVFNGADYLAATLTSIRRQNVQNVEVIVSDGASTDNTLDVAMSCGLPHLVILSGPDQGQLDALQRGIARATGDILVWINGDDIVMPGAFQTVLDVFARHPETEFVYSDDYAFSETRRELYYGPTIRGLRDWDHVLFYRQMYSECVYWRSHITRLLPESYFDLRVYTDYAFFLNLRWGRRGRWIRKRLGAFRVREQQASVAFGSRKQAEFKRVRASHLRGVMFPESALRLTTLVYFPYFAVRHQIYPAFERGFRKVRRIITADSRRRKETEWFYSCWLQRSSAE